MDISNFDEKVINKSKNLIKIVLDATIDNPNNPESLNFFNQIHIDSIF